VKDSLFRVNFHTAFVNSQLLRLTRRELDGPHNDPSFGDDFFVDLIFSPESFADTSVAPDVQEALAVMDEEEDKFAPRKDARVTSTKSIWEIARADAKEGADAREEQEATADGPVLRSPTDAGTIQSADYVPYVPGEPSQQQPPPQQQRQPAVEPAYGIGDIGELEEEAWQLDSAETLRKRAQEREHQAPPKMVDAPKPVKAKPALDDAALEAALEAEIAAEDIESEAERLSVDTNDLLGRPSQDLDNSRASVDTNDLLQTTSEIEGEMAAATAVASTDQGEQDSKQGWVKLPTPKQTTRQTALPEPAEEEDSFEAEMRAALADEGDMEDPEKPLPNVSASLPPTVKAATKVPEPPVAVAPPPKVAESLIQDDADELMDDGLMDELGDDELLAMMEGELGDEGFDLDDMNADVSDAFLEELEAELNL